MFETLESRSFFSISLPPAVSIGAVPPQHSLPGQVQIDANVPPENVGKFFAVEIMATDLTVSSGSQNFFVYRDSLPQYADSYPANDYSFVLNLAPGHHYAFSAVQIAKSSKHGYVYSPLSDIVTFDAPN